MQRDGLFILQQWSTAGYLLWTHTLTAERRQSDRKQQNNSVTSLPEKKISRKFSVFPRIQKFMASLTLIGLSFESISLELCNEKQKFISTNDTWTYVEGDSSFSKWQIRRCCLEKPVHRIQQPNINNVKYEHNYKIKLHEQETPQLFYPSQ